MPYTTHLTDIDISFIESRFPRIAAIIDLRDPDLRLRMSSYKDPGPDWGALIRVRKTITRPEFFDAEAARVWMNSFPADSYRLKSVKVAKWVRWDGSSELVLAQHYATRVEPYVHNKSPVPVHFHAGYRILTTDLVAYDMVSAITLDVDGKKNGILCDDHIVTVSDAIDPFFSPGFEEILIDEIARWVGF
jgi:hypothetical protein